MSRRIPTGKAPQQRAHADDSVKLKLQIFSEIDLMGRWPSTAAKTARGQWYRQCASCQGCGPAVDDHSVGAKLRVKHSANCPSLTAGQLLRRMIAIWVDLAGRIARAQGEQLVGEDHLNGAVRAIVVACDLVIKGQAEIAGILLGPQVLNAICEVCPALEGLLVEGGFPLAELFPLQGWCGEASHH